MTTPVSIDSTAGSEGAPTTVAIPMQTKGGRSKATSSKPTSDASMLPVYSYKDYSLKATTVYTRHEDEANELVEMLRGYVTVFPGITTQAPYLLWTDP